jgi:hypothetical protein
MATPTIPDDTVPGKYTAYFTVDLQIPKQSTGLHGKVYDNQIWPGTEKPPEKLSNRAAEFAKKKDQLATPDLTAVYVPPAPPMGDEIDVILFLHGHKKDDPLTHTSVWHYLRDSRFKLREEVGHPDTTKKVLLVVPSLGEVSAAGKLQTQPDYYLTYLQTVLDKLEVAGDYPTNPYFLASRTDGLKLGKVILACHSGGGVPLAQIINKATTHEQRIRELWIFDALYSSWEVTPLVNWKTAAGHKLDRVVIYYRKGEGTAENSVAVKNKLAGTKKVDMSTQDVDIRAVPEAHVHIPSTYLRPLINSASCLKAK